MKAIRFRVQNFRNINDSDWIPIERVTAFVGRNESGKTTLLKALHKFNPATPESYDPQKEFPRDRYTRDFVSKGSKGEDWPVCSVAFCISDPIKSHISEMLEQDQIPPNEVILTRYYNGSLLIEYSPTVEDKPLPPDAVINGLSAFASSARRLPAPTPEQEETTSSLRISLAEWATSWQDKLKDEVNLRNVTNVNLLATLKSETESKSSPQTADMVEELQATIVPVLDAAKKESVLAQLNKLVEDNLPILIYFENYGILDSAIWLPRFLEDLNQDKTAPRIRTISAMFKHVGLDPREITQLGNEQTRDMLRSGQQPTPEQIAADQRSKEERAIRLSSASNDISDRFSAWWSQRRHKIRYHADGDYFRVWIVDDRRPDVEIELEARSKGFQWFFSFYLVFLVESEEGHKNAILLLDEPGVHLHPTAQQELISFFEKLSERNQLIYTTHSPFLIDGEHLYRVRPVTEDESGHSRISVETWPKDRETIFPLQAAAGYAMVRGLFQHRKNVLVEGMSDYYYLHALSQQCQASGRTALPSDIYITPCGGTKLVGYLASLFLGQEVRPLVLLDGDDAGRARHDALLKELYAGNESGVLMLDDALGRAGQNVEVEDLLNEDIVLPAVNAVLGIELTLNADDRKAGSLPSQIKTAAKRLKIDLQDGWKASVSIHLVSEWDKKKYFLPDTVLDTAALLFLAIQKRFEAVTVTNSK
ncbi:MAG: AAA family ATPase [Methylococcales bacterium]|nr:AAA family ATPase [Methylococcales bacterium]